MNFSAIYMAYQELVVSLFAFSYSYNYNIFHRTSLLSVMQYYL